MMQTEFLLVGKVSLFTGSARGIGFAVTKALGRAGSDLILVDRLAQELDGAVQTIARETERKVLGIRPTWRATRKRRNSVKSRS
jgi:NAD(P)-dependent dehydrogenase (short-subunit alcohol dehydrogenase family)